MAAPTGAQETPPLDIVSGTADGELFGGAFIASRSAITAPDLFNLTAIDDGDIDNYTPSGGGNAVTGTSTYGVAAGTRFTVASPGATPADGGEIIILADTAAANATSATPASGDATSKGAAIQWIQATIAAGAALTIDTADLHGSSTDYVYTREVQGIRTSRTDSGGEALDVAAVYIRAFGTADRLVLTGENYAASTWFGNQNGSTLTYGGALILPTLLADIANIQPNFSAADAFTLTIDVKDSAANSSFAIGFSEAVSGGNALLNEFTITGGAIDFATGRLTVGSGSFTVTTESAAGTDVDVFKGGSLGFIGQIYGTEAESLGGAYWGVANGTAPTVGTANDDKVYGGAFVASRSGITTAPTITYPINTYVLSADQADIDGAVATATYGAASGTRYFTLSGTSGVTRSEISILSNTAAGDVSTATAGSGTATQGADLAWLTTALGAISSTAIADTDRADSTVDGEKTFTTGYSTTGVIEYRTNRTTGTAPNVTALDVASLYLVDNDAADRIVVTGPDYLAASKTHLVGLAGSTLSYVGRLTAPQLLAGAFGTDHADTHRFTLDIVVANATTATFNIGHTRTTGTGTTTVSVFDIEDGLVDLDSGRLTLGGSSTYTVTHKVGSNDAENLYGTDTGAFGLVGQIYGDEAEAVGGTYWGQALGGTNRAFSADDNGKPFGGAFIASFAGSATTVAPTPTITYPQNLFDLSTVAVDIDGSGGAATYGSAVGSRYRVESEGATGVTSSVLILSPSAAADASTATKATPAAPNGVALAWLGTALETALTADNTRGDFSAPTSATDPAVTFTTGSAGGDVVAYETTANTVDVARLLFVNDGSTDRIVVSGSAYAPDLQEVGGTDKSYLARFYDRGTAFRTLVYTGRYSLPRDLSASAAPTNADTWSASLTLTLGAADGAFAFARDAKTVTDATSRTAETFTFSGNVDYTTGKLTYSSGVVASEITTLFTDFQNPTTNNLFRAGTFGFAGQIYGAQAAAVGGTYWGVGDGGADDGKPIGGAFIGSRPIFQYPRHQFNVVSGTRFGVPGDIDNYTDSGGTALTGTSTYGAAFGLNLTTAGPAASPVTSRIAVAAADIASVTLTPGTYFNAQTSTREPSGAPDPANTPVDIAWLSTALEAIDSTAIADTTRADGSGAERTFTAAYTGSGVIEYRTNRPGISQIASLYLIDNGTSDRLAVTGPAFNAPGTGTATLWLQGRAGNTLSYTGRLTAPQLLSDIYSTAHGDTHRFTLDIAAGAIGERTSFTLSHTRTAGSLTNTFTITDGLVNVSRGILALDAASTVVFTDQASGSAAVSLFKAGSFGFIGNLYGTNAQALGGIYWGVGDKASTLVADADDNKVYGGAFIASFSGSATTPVPVTYPQNFFDLSILTGNIDGSGGTAYGSATGSRYRVESDGATGVTSSVLILSPTAGDDATTATIDADSAPNGVALAWLGTALEATASATAATGRDDGAGAAQTFTAAYTGTDVIEYRTNRTAGSPAAPLDVASLYLIDNGADDRIVVTGADYGSQSYLSGQATNTLSYGGRITAPQLLTGVGGTAHTATHGFTLDIVVATSTSATFNIATTTIGTSEFTIDGGAVDLSTGRLTIGGGTATLTESSVALAQATTFGFAGQIYGATADAVGGTYWGRANDSAATFETADAGKPFGGAFIASRSGIAATITYPQNLFDLSTLTVDIDGSGGTGYGSATGSRYRVESAGATGVTSSVLILSPTAGDDATTATINADSAPNGVALAWLGTALEATASATAATGRDDGTGAAQTFTAAYTGTDVIEYRTNRTAGSPAAPLDVASLYLIDNGSDDRLVVTGADYGSQSYLSGQATNTLSYGGRITAPQLLAGVGGTAHTATHGFTLDIVVATGGASATFEIGATSLGASTFTIDGGAVDLSTGRLTIGGGTATLTESSVALAQATTFGFAGQIYGATADAVGGTYWGRANDSAATFETADAGKPFGGAFIASRSGIAATITYPQNLFDLSTLTVDIDGSGGTGYGSATGSRYRVESAGATGVTSSVLILSPTAGDDATTATINADSAPNGVALAWLGTALEATASATAATGRDDGTGAAQTFTAAYTGTDVIEYRTNRTAGSPAAPLDVASLYLIDNGSDDRLVVTGADYGSQSYLSGQATNTLSYGGRITAPQLLAGVGGTAHTATHGFTLDIVVATGGASATFEIGATSLGASTFTIDGGAVDLSTGRLTIGGGTATLTDASAALAQATTFGFAGQIYGDTADAVGGTYWGRANDDAATFDTDADGNPFGGAFIASRSGIAATPVPVSYPQNLFDLTTVTGDIDGSGGTGYGSAIGSRYRVESAGATGVTSSVLILSPTAGDDATTATINADSAPNGVALAWLGTALEATASATAATGRDDGTGAAQTFTAAYTGTDVIEYRTNRTAGSPAAPLDVASLYLIDNGSDDRLVVTGADYGAQSYLSGQATNTLSYGGRITAPQLLAGVGGTAHANTHGFTLDIVVATGGASATFEIGATSLGASTFTIDGGAVDLGTGRLTIGGGTATLTDASAALAQATTFGFAGQIYGDTADAVGGTYWGRANDDAATFDTDADGNPFGGAFIASRSGIAATPVPVSYPQNLFDLTTVTGDIDGSGGTGYGSAIGSRYRVESDGATGVTSSVLILSPTAGDDATTATINADSAPNGVALAWLGTALEATASATAATGRDDGTGAAQTFTAAYTGTDVIEYRTNRTAGSPAAPLDVASLYLIDNGSDDRLVVTGADYGSQSYLSGQATNTLSYGGRITAPQLLAEVGGTAHTATHGFTLDIVVATGGASATFEIGATSLGASTFTIDGGAVDLSTGRLTIGGGTATLTDASAALAQATTFGFAGQIYGDTADAVGGTYWGRANDDAATFDTDADGNPFGGAFIASRSGIAATITYPQNLFDLSTLTVDIDGSGGTGYGSATGSRYRVESAGATGVTSSVLILSPTAGDDATTATINADSAPNGVALAWLGTALEATASATAATGRDDGTGAAQTFTAAYTGTDVIEYRTNRTAGSPAAPLDVASLYLIDNGSDDRLVVTGADYGSQSYLSGQATNTLSYGGRITAPQLLAGVGGTAHANTHGFTLDIVVATGGASATFEIGATSLGASTFTIDGGAVDLGTGRLTIGTGTATLTDASAALAQATTFGFAGQIYGDTADAVGGTYWGRANDDAATFDTDADGNPFGGAFIASRSGIAATPVPVSYPQNLFDLTTVTGDIDGSGGTGYGSAIGTRYRVESDGATGVTSSVLILSPTAGDDATTATINADSAPNGVALAWLGTALEATASATAATGRDDGTGAAQTFTAAYTGTDVIEYRTNRASLDVASLYLINNAASDRIVVTGPDYGSQSYLSGQGGMTLSYGGRITAPQLLSGVGGTAHANTHGFTLDIVVATAGASATFEIGATTLGASTFTIDGGAVDLGTGRLTIGTGTATLTDASAALAQATTFGFAGQIYGDTADAVGGTYWGRANDDAATFDTDADGNPFGGAFIASRSGIAATPVPVSYPQNLFDLSTAATDGGDADIDGSGGTSYGSAVGSRYRVATDGATGVTSSVFILSPTAADDASTATKATPAAPNGVALAWLGTALETQLTDVSARTSHTNAQGKTGTNVIAYATDNTGRDGGVATMYFVDNGTTDRLVLSGDEYDDAFLTDSARDGDPFIYQGPVSLPQDLSGIGSIAHTEFLIGSLTVIADSTVAETAVTFNASRIPAGGPGDGPTNIFTISGGTLNLATGKISQGQGASLSITYQNRSESVWSATEEGKDYGFAGQIFGANAEAAGLVYWGAGDRTNNMDKPIGGAFIGSRSLAPAVTYPQNLFDLATLSGDIDGSGGTGYGSAIGSRYRVESDGATGVTSSVLILSPTAGDDATTATINADSAPNGVALAWLGTALEATASATAATGRDDGTGAAQTFTAAYTGTDVIEYRTNRTAGSPAAPLDVASLYLIDNGSDDRLVVTGADYGSQSYLSGQATNTLSYGGRITAPQLLAEVGGTAHTATHGFTLDIVVATGGASATFEIGATSLGASTFTIDGGAVDLSTGRLTIGGGTATLTDASAALAQATTFGFAGQIYGDTADAVGGTYWGRANDDAATFDTDADGNPFGGAFIASRSGIAATITYPQNLFDLSTLTVDIDGSGGTGYGSATGSRYRVESAGATGVTSSVLILSPTAGDDATTATINADSAPNGVALAWLGTALEATASATAATGRDDGTGAAQTFTAAYTGTDVIEYRTNRTAGSPAAPLDVASLYLIDNGSDDRLVVTGADYGSQSYLSGQATNTLSYGGRITAPQLLAGVGGTAHANTHGFTLDIVVATGGASATFEIGATSLGASTFTIDGGVVDLGTGRLTIGTGTATLTDASAALAQATTFGFAGQIYGDTADAVGGTYWGRANDDAATFDTDADGNPFGGAFIASRSGIAATPVPVSYPQNLFDLTTVTGDIDGSGGTGYGSAIGSRYRVESAGATGVTSSVLILSPTAGDDATTATIDADSAPNGVALAWLGTALEATASATAATGRDDGTGAAQTFTAAYTGTDVIEYRTNRTTGTAPNVTALDVASLYLINNAAADRIVVTGPDYGSQSYLSGQGGMTLSYGGRITAPQLLSGVGGTAHANTHGFTLDIVVATAGASATFDIATTTLGASEFTIDGGAVDLGTGRLTIGTNSATLTESSVALAQATTFGFAGQIYGATADAVGGTYWGRASDIAASFETDDNGKPFGGAFIASRSGIAATPVPVTYPQNFFDLATLSGDIDGSGGTGYGSATGSRYRVESDGATGVTSSVLILSPTAGDDATTATINADSAPNGVALAWLGTALEATASATAATGRDDGTGAAQTFTAAYTGTDVIEYRTNRTTGTAPNVTALDVASLYLINNAAADRIVVTGPDYGSQSYLSGQGGMTLSYGGRITAPQLLAGVGGTAHANTHGFTLDIVVATAGASATFDIATTTLGASEFTIDGGAVDLSTGRLTIGTNSATLTESSVALAQATTFGFAGQIYGATADAVGGTYWGRASDIAASFETDDNGKPFGGAFIASRSGIATTAVPTPTITYVLTYDEDDIDGTPATGTNSTYGAASGTRYFTLSGTPGVTQSEISILSNTAADDVSTATAGSGTTQGADLAWLTAALGAIGSTATADTARADSTVDGEKTFTTGYSATGVTEYRTNRTTGSPATALDVASLYLVDNGDADRIVVTGPDYVPASKTYLEGLGGQALSYVGRLTAPQLLAGAYGTDHADTHRFTLEIVVAAGGSSATFDIRNTSGTGRVSTPDGVFNIDDGEVDLDSGRLTLGNSSTYTVTHQGGGTPFGRAAAENVYKPGTDTFGLAGQIYGDKAEAVGGTYWGQALGGANRAFSAGDDGKPFGGAFIASFAGTYLPNVFSLTGTPGDIDGAPVPPVTSNSTYGVGIGTRTRKESVDSAVDSEIIVITGGASADFSTATDADLPWLSTALETAVTADTGRVDATGAGQTFTVGYKAADSNVIEYRTNGTVGVSPLQVARLYLINNGDDDRLVVTGPDYNAGASETVFTARAGHTSTYTGRIFGAQLLGDVHGVNHEDSGLFTLSILAGTNSATSSFTLDGAYTYATRTNEFRIENGAIDFSTGRLTLGAASSAAVTQRPSSGPGARVFKADTFGFVGQLYGSGGEALGGTYWGVGDDAVNRVSAANDGELFGGAFIASRSAITAPAYPQSLFDLTATDGDIDDYTPSGGTAENGTSTYGVAAGAQFSISAAGATPTETNEIIILSNTAAADATAATPASGDTTSKGAAVDWIHATITAGAALTTSSGGANFHNSFTDYASGNDVVVVRTSRTDSDSDPLDVAAVYVRAYGTGDRLVLAGENYAASSWFGTQNGSTLTYGGALILPTLLANFSGISPTFGGADAFTLTIDVKATAADSSFTITHSDAVSDSNTLLNKFTITDGAVDFATGRLTVGSGSFSVTTESVAGTDVSVFKAGSLGFIGQIYGTEAESLGGAYWGVANGTAPTVVAADDGKVYGGAFVASRSGIARTPVPVTYPQNFFDLATVTADIDGANGTAYGSAAGSRYRIETSATVTGVTSDVIIISPTAAADAGTATKNADSAPNGVALAWLGTALEATASATAETGRADSITVGEKTFTAGYEASGVTEYRTNATTGGDSPTALDIASLYLIDNAAADRIAVTGPDYTAASKSYLTGNAGMTLSYAGLLTVPQLLGDVGGTTHANTRRFTLDLEVADATTATFDLNHEQTVSTLTSKFIIEDGAVDLDTGRLTYVSGTSTATITGQVVADTDINVFNDNSFGLVGQIFGNTADALGGTYWGLGNQAAPLVSNDNNGKPFGGAFIGTRTGIATTPIPPAPGGGGSFPQDLFDLTSLDADIDGDGGTAYGSASGDRHNVQSAGATSVTSDVIIISPTATDDVSTATINTTSAPNGVALDWLGTVLQTTLADDTGRTHKSSADSNKTIAQGKTGTGAIAYSSSVATMYFVENGTNDRIVLTGDEYDSDNYLTNRRLTQSGDKVVYEGIVSAPKELSAVGGIADGEFIQGNLSVTAGGASSKTVVGFTANHTGTSLTDPSYILSITAAEIDLSTGEIRGTEDTVYQFRSSNLFAAQFMPTEVGKDYGFAGQVFGDNAQAAGFVYWGVGTTGSNMDKPIGGAFVGNR